MAKIRSYKKDRFYNGKIQAVKALDIKIGVTRFRLSHYVDKNGINICYNTKNGIDTKKSKNPIFLSFEELSLKLEVNQVKDGRKSVGRKLLNILGNPVTFANSNSVAELNHLTFHPFVIKNKKIVSQRQKIHLHLETLVRKDNHNIRRTNPNPDQLLAFYIQNSYLYNDPNKLGVSSIYLCRNTDHIKDRLNDLGYTSVTTGNLRGLEPVSETIYLDKYGIDGFQIYYHTDLKNFSELFTNPLYSDGYLKYCARKCAFNSLKGFVVVGNPNYSAMNKQNVFVGYLGV